MGYDFTGLIEKANKQEFYEFPVSKESLLFLIKQGKGMVARKLNDALTDVNGEFVIRLPKLGDLSVKEHLGFRNDRFNDAKRKDLIAEIGSVRKCSLSAAETTFSDPSSWGKLPQELKTKLTEFFIAALAETTESSLVARQVTTLIQTRLIEDWQLEWTIALPQSIEEAFIAYLQGESTGWTKPLQEDEFTFTVEALPSVESGKSTGSTTIEGLPTL